MSATRIGDSTTGLGNASARTSAMAASALQRLLRKPGLIQYLTNLGNYNIGPEPGQLASGRQRRRFQPGSRQRQRQQQHRFCQLPAATTPVSGCAGRNQQPGTPGTAAPAAFNSGAAASVCSSGTGNIGVCHSTGRTRAAAGALWTSTTGVASVDFRTGGYSVGGISNPVAHGQLRTGA